MCGIAGFIGFDNKNTLAKDANINQKHRGPDNQGIWCDDYISLAHQRLAIIDVSERANQPFIKDSHVIVFNGEIYNYKELRTEYLKGINCLTQSDTEVVLDMFIKFKEKSLNYFIGMFSFAIYNITTKDLFLARDEFGIKPLFFTKTITGFAFSSELKTLTNIPDFDKTINKRSLIASLNYLWIPGNETMFEGCSKLPPANYLFLDSLGNLMIKKYWELGEETLSNDYVSLELSLKNVLEDSIRRHMIADVPVSSFLSGGLDSSLISVMAQKHNPNITTFTIATENKDKKIEGMPEDEKYAKILANKFKFKHNEITINADIIKDLPSIVRSLDEPIGDPAAINTFLICKAAREKGVKVLLSGMGADEVFCGYRRMRAVVIAKRYKNLPRLVKSIIQWFIENMPVKIFGRGLKLIRWTKKFLSFANLPLAEAYRMSYSYYSPSELKALLNHKDDKFVEEIINEHSMIFNSKFEGDTINQMCNTDINMFMVGLNLTYTDRASMATSVEVRVPFIDKEVISLAMKIPGRFKYRRRETKYILKKIAEDYLPLKIIYRPKASFGAPIRSWISSDLKEMVDDLLSVENIKKRGFLNADYVRALVNNDRSGKEDNAYRIYQLLTLELWFKEFVDNK
ncbi:MAG: asparagine synthase (glutamine-hydrolyzing) [Bacteroidales bacterium]|nr:asparagine synthase (glutamine-hydrolyzing) [Bacteroidales bacterium]